MYTLDILNRLNDINADKDIKSLSHAVFPGTHCPLFGVILTASYIKNMALVVVGTSECTYYAKNFAYHRQEGLDSVYSVAIKESDVVFSAEKKVIVAEETIKDLYDLFEHLSLELKAAEETAGAAITSFRFNLSDGTSYELIYACHGVKNGNLESSTGNFKYFTSADIGSYWDNIDLEAVSVEESELPKVN